MARVNSKKPPHYSAKFAKQPKIFEIAEIHHDCVGCFQCALIGKIWRVNSESDIRTPLVSDDMAKVRISRYWRR
jgi:hypothetical protein